MHLDHAAKLFNSPISLSRKLMHEKRTCTVLLMTDIMGMSHHRSNLHRTNTIIS